MKIMFDGVQFFAFSLDIVRPECSVDIDSALKATLIGVLPIVTAAIMVMISSITAVWKSHILRQSMLKTVPDLKKELSIMWIFHHACLDAFLVQKSVFHKEMKCVHVFSYSLLRCVESIRTLLLNLLIALNQALDFTESLSAGSRRS